MKNVFSFGVCLIAFILAGCSADQLNPSACVFDQAFVTREESKQIADANRWNYAFTLAELGTTLFVGGYQGGDGGTSNLVGVVRKSTDAGDTWSQAGANYNYAGGNSDNRVQHLAVLGTSVYAAVLASKAGEGYHWLVLRSDDLGGTWSVSDDFRLNTGVAGYNYAYGLLPIGSDLLAFGRGGELASSSEGNWVVRKMSGATGVWKTVDNFDSEGGTTTNSPLAGLVADGTVYIAGTVPIGGLNKWVIRKSVDAGESFTSISTDFSLATVAGKLVSVKAMALSGGALYVVGSAVDDSNQRYWLVRKSTDQGLTWNTVKKYQLDTGQAAYALAATGVGSSLFVAGYALDSSGRTHALVHKSGDGGSTWETIDDFYSETAGSIARYYAIQWHQNRLVVAGVTDQSSDSKWLIRTLSCR